MLEYKGIKYEILDMGIINTNLSISEAKKLNLQTSYWSFEEFKNDVDNKIH